MQAVLPKCSAASGSFQGLAENAILCGSIMPIIAPIRFYKSLIYIDFIHHLNDTFVARRHGLENA